MFILVKTLVMFWTLVRVAALAGVVYFGYLVYSDADAVMRNIGSAAGSAVAGFRHSADAKEAGR